MEIAKLTSAQESLSGSALRLGELFLQFLLLAGRAGRVELDGALCSSH